MNDTMANFAMLSLFWTIVHPWEKSRLWWNFYFQRDRFIIGTRWRLCSKKILATSGMGQVMGISFGRGSGVVQAHLIGHQVFGGHFVRDGGRLLMKTVVVIVNRHRALVGRRTWPGITERERIDTLGYLSNWNFNIIHPINTPLKWRWPSSM